MSDIDSFIEKLESFANNLSDMIDRTVVNNEDYLITEVLQKRLYDGVTGEGLSLPEYAPKTIANKIRLNMRYSNMTLTHTGSWYKQMYITSIQGVVEVDSLDEKTDTLVFRYGKSILEFQEVEQQIFIEDVLDPVIQKRIDEMVGNIKIEIA